MGNDQAIISNLTCTISLEKSLAYGKHSYEYTIKNFKDDFFYFTIPNAQVNDVNDVFVHDKNAQLDYQPSVQKEAENGHTVLLFRNLVKVDNGTPKKLNFSYRAPSSALRHKTMSMIVTFYQSKLYHDLETESLKVVVELPKGARVVSSLSEGTIEKEKVIFNKDNLKSGQVYEFPIFFYFKRRFRSALFSLIPLSIGAILSVVFQSVVDYLNFENKIN